jgi:hypothetical protein
MKKKFILFHGRHLLHTRYQQELLPTLIKTLTTEGAEPLEVVFAITSANHANSRYNPVSFQYRAIGVDRFASEVLAPHGVAWSIVPIPHLAQTDQFVKRICAYVHAAHEVTITPDSTLVLCSTAPLIQQFRREGFEVMTGEYDETRNALVEPTPQDLLVSYAATLSNWKGNPELKEQLSDATIHLWQDYAEIPREIERLWNETLLTEHGDITETRDYDTYTFSMSRNEVIDLKYGDIKAGIVPGVIVDEGCADGALLTRIAKNFPDSDLIGIEITREFIAQAHERQRRGEFGKSFVFFYQRNLSHPIFPDDTVDTTICNSTTHEIWSYAGEDAALREYLAYKYAQLRPGGALLIRDVIGPEQGEGEIYATWDTADGRTVSAEEAMHLPPAELSTRSRFDRFSREFYNGKGIAYREVEQEGKSYTILSRKDAAEFLLTKSYTDSWESELHEDFTHWSYSRWKEELERIGFTLDESRSKTYTNEWIAEHYFKGSRLYRMEKGTLVPEPYPPTNVILVAYK